MEKIVLNVEGMSCEHCENAVKNAVNQLEGVKGVSVDLAAKTVSVEFESSKVNPTQIQDAIDDQGYEVIK